jgi:hypothetical protein
MTKANRPKLLVTVPKNGVSIAERTGPRSTHIIQARYKAVSAALDGGKPLKLQKEAAKF